MSKSLTVKTPRRHKDQQRSIPSLSDIRRTPRPRVQKLDVIVREKGWTDEDLRRCNDVPKQLAPGSRIIKMPADILEDPFINEPVVDPGHEYDIAETRFYNRLSKFVLTQRSRKKESKIKRNHVRVTIRGDEKTDGIHFEVSKQAVDVVFTFQPKKKKKKR